MTLAEMRQGALDANWGPRKRGLLEAYLADFSVLHSDSALCAAWAEVRHESGRKGRHINAADAWIAATARSAACHSTCRRGSWATASPTRSSDTTGLLIPNTAVRSAAIP